MYPEPSEKALRLREDLLNFMASYVYPNEMLLHPEDGVWSIPPLLEELKAKARAQGLWNLFLPDSHHGSGLTNAEYAPLAEIMGRSIGASEIFNCSPGDTGNMELLVRFGTEQQKRMWLYPLLDGKIRSSFVMTEPSVASSDATNIATSIVSDGDNYVINGHKWWSSGVGDPRCRVLFVLGRSDPHNPDRYRRHSIVICPFPLQGIEVVRSLNVLGHNDAPHGHMEVIFRNVHVPKENILLGEGRGFEAAQGRLGPGRIHHCMRALGAAERALERLCRRLDQRIAFGRKLAEQTVWLERIAESRCMIDQARLLTLRAAHRMDVAGIKEARADIAMIKLVAGNVACRVIDWAIQGFGAAGLTDRFLAHAYTSARALRILDGPDEVHRNQVGRMEIRKYQDVDPEPTGGQGEPLR